MQVKLACVGYRKWAIEIYQNLIKDLECDFLILNKESFNNNKIFDFQPDIIFFYGWSWQIDEEIHKNFKSIMLHPSDLPRFRGGSPLQNQIIRGVLDTKITLFIINEEYDAGDILVQKDLSLRGSLEEIFMRIVEKGTEMTKEILNEMPRPAKQDETKATYYPRRTPKQSEITLDELASKPSGYLYNKIRMLSDPYPNAYIKTSDGKKLLIKLAEVEKIND